MYIYIFALAGQNIGGEYYFNVPPARPLNWTRSMTVRMVVDSTSIKVLQDIFREWMVFLLILALVASLITP
jgi:hypothetical protein